MTRNGDVLIARPLLLASMLLLAACSADKQPHVSEDELQEFGVEARYAADLLGSRLKARLKSSLETEGPFAAIEVCAEEAPMIAADVSSETGLSVRRTALRIRNASNAPDTWEREMLDYFSRSLSAGDQDAVTLEKSSVDSVGGQLTYRWARPILLEPQCSMCHGNNIGEDMRNAIALRYPNDEATGFEAGELRGIFSVQR